jgi:uncharacterized membrane protein YphA (DoxX/SURF4 family)
MSSRKLVAVYVVTFAVVSLPFTIIHLMARPDDAPITPLQHIVAGFANYFGPWGVGIVRLVDFPNAGLRSFSWVLAVGLTLLAGILILLPMRTKSRQLQLIVATCWALFSIVWFTVGLSQIASGLL